MWVYNGSLYVCGSNSPAFFKSNAAVTSWTNPGTLPNFTYDSFTPVLIGNLLYYHQHRGPSGSVLWKYNLDDGTSSVESYVNNGGIPYNAFQYGVGAHHAATNTLYIIGTLIPYAGGTSGAPIGVITYNFTTGAWGRLANLGRTISYDCGAYQGNKPVVVGNNIYYVGTDPSGSIRGVAVYTIGTGVTKFTSLGVSGHVASIGYQNSIIYLITSGPIKAYSIADDTVVTKIASTPDSQQGCAADILNGNLYYARWISSVNGTSVPNPPPSNIRKVI
jgi:hypothetical protein